MPKQEEGVSLIDEIIDHASQLPLEYQEMLLAMAKGMAFSKSCLCKQEGCKEDEKKTA